MTMTITVWDENARKVGQVHPHPGSPGYRRCGVSFNPSEDRRVTMIKDLAAGLMEEISNEMSRLAGDDADGRRCMATAMTHLEAAQMFAVKGLFMMA